MNIFKQTITSMKQQPLLTGLTIAGTALSICLIMIVMMTREVKIADYGCEPYRSRTLYAKHLYLKSPNGKTYSNLRLEDMRGVFLKLKTPEHIAIYSGYASPVNAAVQGKDNVCVNAKAVNSVFFDVFPMKFIEGKPFTPEECESNMPIAIISRTACRNIFGQDNGIKGKTFNIENHEYRVAGIVEDVSPILSSAYSEIWVPVSTVPGTVHPLERTLYTEYDMRAALVAKSSDDFPKIRTEVERMLAAYNKSIAPDTLDLMDQPDTQEVYVNRKYSNDIPDMKNIYLHYIIIFAILLIVPAINIASMSQSLLQRRREEIGIRRAFGAKRSTILIQTIIESLLQTLAAGAVGLLLCLVACFTLGNYIFPTGWMDNAPDMHLDTGILLSPGVYCWTLLFCLLLNMLSNTIPAWTASRNNIVEALKKE